MTVSVKHAFQSAISDSTTAINAGEVTPTRWNDTHTFTGTVNSLLGFDASGAAQSVSGSSIAGTLASFSSVNGQFQALGGSSIAGQLAAFSTANGQFQAIGGSTINDFWSNINHGLGTPINFRYGDRLFIGNAVGGPDTRSGAAWGTGTWISSGASFIPRDSQLAVMSNNGTIAISGGSRASLFPDSASFAPIGVSGYIINDISSAQYVFNGAAWAFYADIQHQPALAASNSYGMEIAAKNAGTNTTCDPYSRGSGVYGIWAAGGGDNAYGPPSANPSNCVLMAVKNSNTWNVGVNFESVALTRDSSGFGYAMNLAAGHALRWFASAGTVSATISASASGLIMNGQLPTSNPHVSGQWWSNAGVVQISTG